MMRFLSNRPDSWINSRVNSSFFLLRSFGKSCVKGSFGILTYPSGRSNAKNRA